MVSIRPYSQTQLSSVKEVWLKWKCKFFIVCCWPWNRKSHKIQTLFDSCCCFTLLCVGWINLLWRIHLIPTTPKLRWRHNGHGGVPNHQPHGCLFNRLFRLRTNETATLRVTGLCVRNSPVTSEIPAQMASNAENVSSWWRHHEQHTERMRYSMHVFVLCVCSKRLIPGLGVTN